MVPDWETNHVCFSDLLPERHRSVWFQIEAALDKEGISWELLEGTKDIWCRDYMPVQVGVGEYVQFRYYPDYLRHAKHLLTPPIKLPWMGKVKESDIVLDGGNLVTNGKLAILTDKILSDNAYRSRTGLQIELSELLKFNFVKDVNIVPSRPHEVTGHMDGVAAFLDEKRLLVTDLRSMGDEKYAGDLERAIGGQFTLETMPGYFVEYFLRFRFPTAEGCYLNYLRVGDVVLFPQYGDADYDGQALGVIKKLLPQCRVHPIQCREVAKGGGALHCISWNVMREEKNQLV